MTTGKTIALNTWTFAGKVMSLLFNTLSRFIIAFLPRSKCLNFLAAVTMHSDFRDQENKICRCLHFSVIYLHEVMRLDAIILIFLFVFVCLFFNAAFEASFSLCSFTLIKRLFSSSSLSLGRYHLLMWSKE